MWIMQRLKGKIKQHHPHKLKGQRQHTQTGLCCSRHTLLLELVVNFEQYNNTVMWPESIIHREICRAGEKTLFINLWLMWGELGAVQWLSFNIKETLPLWLLLWNTVCTHKAALLGRDFNKATVSAALCSSLPITGYQECSKLLILCIHFY